MKYFNIIFCLLFLLPLLCKINNSRLTLLHAQTKDLSYSQLKTNEEEYKLKKSIKNISVPQFSLRDYNLLADKIYGFRLKIKSLYLNYNSEDIFNKKDNPWISNLSFSASIQLKDIINGEENNLYNQNLNTKNSSSNNLPVESKSNSWWKLVVVGTAAIVIVVAAFSLLSPHPNQTIADPPARP